MVETVLIVAHAHPELSPGGAEIVAYRLFDELRRQENIAVHFLAATDDPAAIEQGAAFSAFQGRPDETLFLSNDVDNFRFSQKSEAAIDAFIQVLERVRPAIIHFHHYFNVGLELFAAARQRLPTAKLLLTLHEYHAICAHWGLMVKPGSAALCVRAAPEDCSRCFPNRPPAAFEQRHRFIRSHLDQIDMFVAPSRFLRTRYIAWGIAPTRITVIDNGTSVVEPPPPRPLQSGQRRSVFGFFGQINPFKGLVPLLSAFERLKQNSAGRTSDLRLVINGAYLELNNPDYVATVRELLGRTAAQTHLAGSYQYGDLSQLMAEIDWVIVPSIWWENAPLVIEEALAHRRPVICSNIGGMAEKVRHGRDGLHFPVGDPGALAETLLRAVEDNELWDRLRGTMRSPPGAEAFLAQHLQLYQQIGGHVRGADPNISEASAQSTGPVSEPDCVLTGGLQIIDLGRGFHRLDIAGLASADRPSTDAVDRVIHVCSLPAHDGTDVLLSSDGASGHDIWLGPEGGVIFAAARDDSSRVLITAYHGPEADADTPQVNARRIADAPA
jgi:glycosyltransferase involved in cell wall biosynthesis